MRKSLSIKTQLIIVMLIPITGLVYMTISNIKSSFDDYNKIDHALENINNISNLSRGIEEISNERGFYAYSIYDSSKLNGFGIEKQKTIDWFLNMKTEDTVITKNMLSLKASILSLQSDIEKGKSSNTNAIIEYTLLNKTLYNLIERKIITCEDKNLSQLANNYYNYVTLREAFYLKRGIVLQKLMSNFKSVEFGNSLLELYFKAKDYESIVDFKINNSSLKDVNKGLVKFINSDLVLTLNSDAESIVENKMLKAPDLWWNQANAVASKIKKLEKQNLAYILNYANGQKQSAIQSIVFLGSILFLFLVLTVFLIYILIKRLSKSLKLISSSIERISVGEIIQDQHISGSTEFIQINQSFNDLLVAKREHIDLCLKISTGEFGTTIRLRSEHDILNESLNNMSLELSRLHTESLEISQMERNVIEINKSIVEAKNLDEFGTKISQTIVSQTEGCQSNFYVLDSNENSNLLKRIGGYASNEKTPTSIEIGQGMVGEAAKMNKQICLNNLSNSYSHISSSLGNSAFYNVLITPITYKNSVIGIIEIGSLENFTENHKKLLNSVSNTVGNALEVFIRNEELKISLEEINNKNVILESQEAELRQSNVELSRQTLLLQQSEEELRNQAAEMEQTNAYLEDQRTELENKNREIGLKNDELLIAQQDLSNKAKVIEQASKYKSEFLANMSHELRTPLNSILILSDIMKENSVGNLIDSQIENLEVINTSGKDLLNLITDILDISKIEAGKAEIHLEISNIERVSSDMQGLFDAQMHKKNIEFKTTISDDCPKLLNTDIGKLEQILKNFLSNALKFTPENGKVKLSFTSGKGRVDFKSISLAKLDPNEILSVYIEDSGIGISEENKSKLFQSFQQVDSSTSRKYGGTGLGLYISKELSTLLGGEVDFESELNKGSIFSVHIPVIFQTDVENINSTVIENEITEELVVVPSNLHETIDLTENLDDDRNKVSADDKTILIVEDDLSFADVLMQVAHENGFKAIIASQGEMGFEYAKKYKPKAIILDMKLPGIDGWTVLKWLKADKDLKHIPVHVMSGMKKEKLAAEMGAFDFLVKPITVDRLKEAFASIDNQINKIFKKVLILEDNLKLNYSIKELVQSADNNIICIQVYTFEEAEHILKTEEVDCAIMDIGLEDSSDIQNISKLRKVSKNNNINIIVNTGRYLTEEEELELHNNADSIVIKTENATERLKDELMLFLNKVKVYDHQELVVNEDLLGGGILKNKNILIVDDDIRNIYSLSSALTTKGASILTAFNGKEALEVLAANDNIDLVLMDIMMPEMDGFEATRKIRENYNWKNLPIIALTAKAMKGDREEILNAGASDYMSKPIDIQKLISLISIWIYN